MATQGLVTVTKGKSIIAKIVAGDNGYNAKNTANGVLAYFRDVGLGNDPNPMASLYCIAKVNGFGCESCLVVIGKSKDGLVILDHDMAVPTLTYLLSECQMDYYKLYEGTFDIMNFNPRWSRGTVYHGWRVNLDTMKISKMRTYKGEEIS